MEAPSVLGRRGAAPASILLLRDVGASLSESTFSRSPRFGNHENVKNSMFLTEKNNEPWSFGFDTKKNTKI